MDIWVFIKGWWHILSRVVGVFIITTIGTLIMGAAIYGIFYVLNLLFN
ncbi:MAG: hypothetical protein PHQ32_06735 [Firmicutes bacterium]|nr:hypothetical protein [Bacillota bacterium]